MDVGRSKSRHEGRDERDAMEESPVREHRDGRRKEKEHRSKDRDKEYDREKNREKEREREREKDHRRDREKERDRRRDRDDTEKESERSRDKERGKDKSRDRDRDRDRDREKERERDRVKDDDREKRKDREKDRETEKDRHREKIKEKSKEKESDVDKEKDRPRDRERASRKNHEEDHERDKDVVKYDHDDDKQEDKDETKAVVVSGGEQVSASDLGERVSKMREERLMKESEGASEVLAWVSKSRKLEEKRNSEKEKAQLRLKIFEEQDNLVQGESEDEDTGNNATHDLSGVKVLHGLDKVMEGGAVVLTLKDQNVLADGDINNDIDMLENVEIGEQKRRDDAYKAAKKKTGIYDDRFNDEPGAEKKILPQYDEPADDGGVTLDDKGRFTVEAEKKLQELRRRIQGQTTNHFQDLSSSAKSSSDYYTQEEMLQFKKPKKKKSMRKKEKLDIAALEAEAVAAGLGAEDLGSRNDSRRQEMREEQERSEAEKRSNAYQSAYAKAEEASRLLRMEQVQPLNVAEDENSMFADDDEDLYKSLQRARKLALQKQEESAAGPQAVARLATSSANQTATDDKNLSSGESQENKVVLTEMEEFVWGLQLDEDVRKPDTEDVFMEEDEAPKASVEETEEEVGGWAEVKDGVTDENPLDGKDEMVPDETIHEVAVGKGLSGALKLLKERGTLKETIEWGGRNMDKKKSKLVGLVDNDGGKERFKDIRIERTDEFGRTLTAKEAFRQLSHKFHGKGPGKMKQEKRMKQYEEELKLKQMKNSDTPSLSVERMREAQAQLKTPYLVLSGHVKPGQTSDPQSGFATVEKNFPGSLTPMLGDKKVEHFLGIKRKAEPENSGAPKKPKT